jgi:hypothetical protein
VPVVVVTISPVPASVIGNATTGPVAGNISATPNATGVTERVGSNVWALLAIIILALMLMGMAAWDLWKHGKKK